jgi:diguanylate cyclase (GGDEF)-like protein
MPWEGPLATSMLGALLAVVHHAARIGGDEFGVLVQGASGPDDIAAVADKIVTALGLPFLVRDLSLSVGASAGVTIFPDGADSYDSVVARADSAMYRAKAAARGGSP